MGQAMTDDNQDFANGLRALQGSKIPLEDEMRILARIKAMRTTQEVVEWVYGLEQALEILASHSRFIEVDQACWYCSICDEEAGIGEEMNHDPDCCVGKARTAIRKHEEEMDNG